jgi:hypothetical protein
MEEALLVPGRDLRFPRISLRAIFSGVVLAFVVEAILLVLGAAIGLSVFGASATAGTARSVGIGGAVWLIISLCISMFIGALTAAEVARAALRRDGALNGLVAWATASLLGLFMLGAFLTGTASAGMASRAATEDQMNTSASRLEETMKNPEQQAKISRGAALGSWALLGALVIPGVFALLGGFVGSSSERRFLLPSPTPRGRRDYPTTGIPQPT